MVLLDETFIAHEDCWTFLDRQLTGLIGKLKFLNLVQSVYRSFPDLRGPSNDDDPRRDDWEEWWDDCEDGVDEGLWPWQSHLTRATAQQDHSTRSPLDVLPELKVFLKRMPEQNLPEAFTGDHTGNCTRVRPDDCFSVLAPELIIMIASYLPSHEALALRTLSRSFGFIFHDQQFWASRFTPDGERSWLAEVRRAQLDQAPDWRLLYHESRPSNPGVYFSNAKRVIASVRMLSQIHRLRHIEDPWRRAQSHRELPSDAEIVHGLVPNQYNTDFREGCRVFVTHRAWDIHWPIAVSVYTVQLGSGGKRASYICGIKILCKNQSRGVGYQSSMEHTVSVDELTGFEVSVARRGIKAIRCQSGSGDLTPWLGHPEGGIETDGLLYGRRVNAIGGWFDVSNLIFINVSRFQLMFPRE